MIFSVCITLFLMKFFFTDGAIQPNYPSWIPPVIAYPAHIEYNERLGLPLRLFVLWNRIPLASSSNELFLFTSYPPPQTELSITLFSPILHIFDFSLSPKMLFTHGEAPPPPSSAPLRPAYIPVPHHEPYSPQFIGFLLPLYHSTPLELLF